MAGNLYIISTPIGNLGDITLRALDALRSINYIACEDTRVTRKLLNHYGINLKLVSYNNINEKSISWQIKRHPGTPLELIKKQYQAINKT